MIIKDWICSHFLTLDALPEVVPVSPGGRILVKFVLSPPNVNKVIFRSADYVFSVRTETDWR